MIFRGGLESIRIRHKSIIPASSRRYGCFCVSDMADLTVVVFLRLVIGRVRGSHKGSSDQLTKQWPQTHPSDNILVLVVGKLDGELLWPARITKTETRVMARGSFCVTDPANDGLRPFEELSAVTAHAGVVAGKVGNVGKISGLLPIRGGYLMAGVAGPLMLFSDMQEF